MSKNSIKSHFFEKKLPKILSVSKKALPLHSHLEKCLRQSGIFEQARAESLLYAECRRKCQVFEENAEIAQLVEHNLAKVGVAGPSPVFRSLVEQKRVIKERP